MEVKALEKPYVDFPLRIPKDLHGLLRRAAFARNISMQRYCLEAIRKEAERDAQSVQVSPLPNQGAGEEAE